jgi:hypothetical protein
MSETPLDFGREGEKRAFDNASDKWKELALAAVYELCKTRATFICDDVWEMLKSMDVVCLEKRALAGVLTAAENAGWCHRTRELRRSAQKQCHGNLRTVWASDLFERAAA